MSDKSINNKSLVWDYYLKLSAAAGNSKSVHEIIKGYLHEDVVLHAMQPVNELHGKEAVFKELWKPLIEAFPDLERQTDIFIGGNFKGDDWISASGHLVGTFYQDWQGIPATGKMVALRFGESLRIVDGKIKEIYFMIDILDLMRQAEVWPLESSLGTEAWWPKPSNNKGIILTPAIPSDTQKTLKLHARWLDELKGFPETSKSFDQLRADEYLHPRYMQYASAAFGTTRGAYGFKEFYLTPLFSGFTQRKLGHYQTRIAEGNMLAAKGWDCFVGHHTGKILGREKTGKKVKVRMMEWWRRTGNVFKENWLLIDTPDLLQQIGIDVFAEMRDIQTKDVWL